MNTPLQLIDLREAAMLDYYVSAFWWGREQEFSIEQLSAFFTVVHTLLNNIKGKALFACCVSFRRLIFGIIFDSITH